MHQESRDGRSLGQLCQEALDIQDACNLSGVVHAWSRSISRLRVLCPDNSTDWYNTHPINVLFADKLFMLVNSSPGQVGMVVKLAEAIDACHGVIEVESKELDRVLAMIGI